MDKQSALLIVDVQNDFCPGGALPVPEGDKVVEPLNRAAERFAAAGLPVLVSRDWHPTVTRHFKEYGGLWPPHCVQESRGAAFHPALRLPAGTSLMSKGTDPELDSYSAFDAVAPEGGSLQEFLQAEGVRHIYIGGLATDYCVRASVLDALKAGFSVTVLTDAVAGVDVKPGDSELALEEMDRAGARFCTVDELIESLQT